MQKKVFITFITSLFILMNAPVNAFKHYGDSTTTFYSEDVSPKKYTKKNCYRVFGKRYQVMPSSKNYEERGVASWYGRPFHWRRTSSGQRYNMYKLTAAHKTLPLSTRVLVTNLRNGRQVVVVVNDRGPFVSNRIIDLSYAAAKKLGMVGAGTAPVRVKALV